MGGSGNRGKLSIGVSVYGEPEPDNGWMYRLFLLRIHRACACPATLSCPSGSSPVFDNERKFGTIVHRQLGGAEHMK